MSERKADRNAGANAVLIMNVAMMLICLAGIVYCGETDGIGDTPLMMFLFMIAAHVVADFYLQGILAKMKQRSWWQKELEQSDVPDKELYYYDYIPPLLFHGLIWAMAVSIPVMVYCGTYALPNWYCGLVVAMGLVHAWVDHCKCNRYSLSLVDDQMVHVAQVLTMWVYAALMMA